MESELNVLFSDLDPPMAVAFVLSSVLLLAALGLSLRRIIKGPSAFDRVVALDLFGGLCLCLIVFFSIFFDQGVLLDAALAIALVSFLGTVAFARYLGQEDVK
ncbi:MAG: multicomponent Na+:H+ antiporter subunit F [Lentimonas sp.]|jgi:multicomponent Na+:H+ antiporter subunit F